MWLQERTGRTFTKNLNCYPPNSSLSPSISDPWEEMIQSYSFRVVQAKILLLEYWGFIADLCALVKNLIIHKLDGLLAKLNLV